MAVSRLGLSQDAGSTDPVAGIVVSLSRACAATRLRTPTVHVDCLCGVFMSYDSPVMGNGQGPPSDGV
jgi:hypothetical protein